MNKSVLRSKFEAMLPSDLGLPYVMNTFDEPYRFVAFYDAQRHFIGKILSTNRQIIDGNEFRLCSFDNSENPRILAGIIGLDVEAYQMTIVALTDCNTRQTDLAPHSEMIREMYHQAITS